VKVICVGKKILVTGSAGFIGFHLSKKLLEEGWSVVGLDNYTPYYDVSIKKARAKILAGFDNYEEKVMDITDKEKLAQMFKEEKFDKVVNLAAQAGVRYSLTHPFVYETANNAGFLSVLEACRNFGVKDIVYASSSSVYGKNTKIPFSEEDKTDSPISLYAATKKYNELAAHTYSELYDINTTGLRFFTVYGPYGRPDMALFLFTKAILENKPIDLFNNGNMERDFTYVSDIVSGIMASIEKPFKHEVFNLGNGNPIQLTKFVELISKNLNKKAKTNMLPMQQGDVAKTFADVSKAERMIGYKPKVNVEEGVKKFVEWYKEYYNIKA